MLKYKIKVRMSPSKIIPIITRYILKLISSHKHSKILKEWLIVHNLQVFNKIKKTNFQTQNHIILSYTKYNMVVNIIINIQCFKNY